MHAEGQGVSLALRRIWRAPALRALLIQCAALLPTAATLYLLARLGVSVSMAGAALLQGSFAAALTWCGRLAPWWRAIGFLFPVAVPGALALELPPALFLAAFVLLVALYWSSFRTQVPYYPSGARVWHEVERLLPQGRALRVIDIGSGLGGLVLQLARRRPESRIEGIELAPLPWLVSSLRARLAGSGARFMRGDYERLDFGAYDAVFAYLSPAAMDALWRKAAAEMRPGSMLLSYEFPVEDHAPDLVVVPQGRGPVLYGWHF